jgi:hypothetical protein
MLENPHDEILTEPMVEMRNGDVEKSTGKDGLNVVLVSVKVPDVTFMRENP